MTRTCRQLSQELIGVHDSFFDLGGNSLRLLSVRTALREHENGGEIGLVDLFRHPTVTVLADLLDRPAGALRENPRPSADPLHQGRTRRERLAAPRNTSSQKGSP
ncbi:acyl carrier protein [Streptomyces sp. SID12501]|uniref:Acyl carrier protein n=1 Tax=Streptomyces sp. SID12501 TaxID=2706042 RepID=A0A6B3C5P5_9ACTN|nr:acyl carrier protein [Streptomyces sp. SID12501]